MGCRHKGSPQLKRPILRLNGLSHPQTSISDDKIAGVGGPPEDTGSYTPVPSLRGESVNPFLFDGQIQKRVKGRVANCHCDNEGPKATKILGWLLLDTDAATTIPHQGMDGYREPGNGHGYSRVGT